MGKVYDFFKTYWKQILIVVVIIIIILYFRRNWYKLFSSVPGSVTVEGKQTVIPQIKQDKAKQVAQDLYNDIYDTSIFKGHNSSVYADANTLTDPELVFMNNYYKAYLSSGVTLYTDITEEYYISADEVNKLADRLKKLNLQ